MTIKVGDAIPSLTLYAFGADGPESVLTDDIFKGKKVVMFGLPGAFTPTCSAQHLPGYMAKAEALRAKGVDAIVCLSVNDAFVMGAWARDLEVGDKVLLAGDGDGEFTRAAGLELDLTGKGMGVRCRRFSLIAEDGVVKVLNLEDGGAFEVSSAEKMLEQL